MNGNRDEQGASILNKKLWVTYAWKDNADLDVDFIIQELEKKDIDVRFDRRQLLTGRSLWTQIDQNITDPHNSDAWAIIVSKQSLESAPCREELAYALHRALDTRGEAYPLIGIFIENIDRDLIPSAIATRLYVNVESGDWADSVKAGVDGIPANAPPQNIEPVHVKLWTDLSWPGAIAVIEIRPRAGLWNPVTVAVPIEDKDCLGITLIRPAGKVPPPGITMNSGKGPSKDGLFHVSSVYNSDVASPTMSVYVVLLSRPSRLIVSTGSDSYVINLAVVWKV